MALTLLTFDVVAAAKGPGPGTTLAGHLVRQWPTFVAFAVGFVTILVCWINHHFVFGFVRRATPMLLWVNGLQLALVATVPFPTAVLASNIDGAADDRRTALLLYGMLFWLIATSFWILWRFVNARGLVDVSADPTRARGTGVNYALSSVWTILCLVVASVSVYPALVMWAAMFVVFAFPAGFAAFTGRRLAA